MPCYCGGCNDCLRAQGFSGHEEDEVCLQCGADMSNEEDFIFGPYCSLECEQLATDEAIDPRSWDEVIRERIEDPVDPFGSW